MIYGYARCSLTEKEQDINRQVRELRQAGADEIYLEYEHGDSKVKKELQSLLDVCNTGDTIITLEISRLARSTKQLCEIIEIIKDKKLCLKIVNSITVDCTKGILDPMTNAFIQISGVFAELELRIIRTRVASGVANAKAKGKRIGRPEFKCEDIPDKFYKYYQYYKEGKINKVELSRITNLSRNTVYKYIREIEKHSKSKRT